VLVESFFFKGQKEETGSKSRNLNQEIFTFKSLFKREERKTKQKRLIDQNKIAIFAT
jgi:hypothetical protein